MLIIALNNSGPNNLGPGNFIILPIKMPKYTITNKIIKLIRSKSIIGQMASLLNDPGNDIKINDGIVNTVKKILIICIIPTCLESAPHSSAPKTISRSPPGEAIKNASGFSIFLAFAPGGVNEMGLLAFLLNIEPAFVITHHLFRLSVVVVILGLAQKFLYPKFKLMVKQR